MTTFTDQTLGGVKYPFYSCPDLSPNCALSAMVNHTIDTFA